MCRQCRRAPPDRTRAAFRSRRHRALRSTRVRHWPNSPARMARHIRLTRLLDDPLRASHDRVARADASALWLSQITGERLFSNSIAAMLRKLGNKAALPHGLTCHTFRRTCATELLRNGAHPEMVRMMLGHSSLNTLAQYLRVTINDIKSMHENSNPGQ